MTKGLRNRHLLACALPFAMIASTALAQDAATAEKTDPVSVDLNLAVVSDYRFRGISLSNKDPAFQPSITVTHESGFYASVWGSNIADNGGDKVEIDLTAGFSKEVGGFNLGALAVYYLYPGAGDTNYVEFQASANHAVGPGTVGVLVAYAPKQANIGDVDNIYAAVNGSLPIPKTPLTLVGSFGIEDGAFGSDNKKDWSLGVNASIKGFTLGASYVDTSHTGGNPLGSSTVVVSLSKTF
jgi:uncharacterized protein (TIGR02001 family)